MNVITESMKMDCENRERLRAFVERRLDERGMGEVAAHIAACATCQEYVRFYAEFLAAPAEGDGKPEGPEPRIREIASEAMDLALAKLARQREIADLSRGIWDDLVRMFRQLDSVGLAAADGQSANQKQAADAADAGFFHFCSRGDKNDTAPNGWRARLIKPPSRGTSDKYVLQFRIEGSDGTPVPSGQLVFCGRCFGVRNGRALVPKSEFLEACANRMISLKWPNGEEVPGTPVL